VRGIRSQAAATVRQLASHPAALLFAVGNEIPPAIVRWHGADRAERFLRGLYDSCKQAAPDALVTYAIGEFNKIQTQATEKVPVSDGDGGTVEVERINPVTQGRLMIAKSLVEPKAASLDTMGTRLYGALNKMVRDLNFGDEPETDAKGKAKTAKADETPEGKPAGNP